MGNFIGKNNNTTAGFCCVNVKLGFFYKFIQNFNAL